MKLLNNALTWIFDLLFAPFAGMPPIVGLTVFSVITGILMLWIFGKVSNQDAIRVIRDRIRGNLIAVRLFGDDLGLLFKLQWRLLRDNVVFLKYALIPLLILLLPVLFILSQLNLRYAMQPLAPGESAMVKVTMHESADVMSDVTLEAPQGVVVETPGVRVAPRREVAWRIRPTEAGDFRLVVRGGGGEPVEKQLRVGDRWGATPALRSAKFLDLLLYPGEAPIPAGLIETVEVKYKPLPLSLFGFPVHWLVFFFLLSIIAGFAFRRVLGVEI